MDGILIVDKPQGLTSHDVVDFMRRRFGLKKVGHAGTLDPMATGVLVMLIGKCTRQSSSFMKDDKDYEGAMVLGATSDTGDAWGKITPAMKPVDFTDEAIRRVFNHFTGEIVQRPPMYSAVKVNGKKLYELARKGIDVEVAPRTVSIKKLEIESIKLPQIRFAVTCSKGTYIRQLAVDIGEELGCGAYLSELKRTRSGTFSISDALLMEELKALPAAELESRLRYP